MRHTQVKNWVGGEKGQQPGADHPTTVQPANNCLIVCADSIPPLTDKLHTFNKAHYCNNKNGIFNYKGDT